ncbi:Pre-mRNA-splicing factor cwf18 [Acrodontium crateriforme]|uniref:Pre-mRNA-splicing factor cwf18 n=1 Tax=Acrodontium crateriforme TaxID=150365 RepID=A0AAQ3M1S3_9PEZI|nr:Pre-mRNA-splicing factor cwf18 [Acrodontium crateriforme]
MASTQALSAAAQDRKSRLAQLKSLKRKQPDSSQDLTGDSGDVSALQRDEQNDIVSIVPPSYLSGRNYDVETKGAKLGFENAPSEGQQTLEKRAEELAQETKMQAEQEQKADKPLDLFQLQPKKPNWDLKRDLDRKLDILGVRTDNAIARMVRERIANQQKAAKARAANGQDVEGEAVGMEGASLVEATNVREREDEEDARREREDEEALLGQP